MGPSSSLHDTATPAIGAVAGLLDGSATTGLANLLNRLLGL